MLAESVAALGAIKESINIAKVLVEAKNEVDRMTAVAALQSALLDVQGKALDLQTRCAELQEEVAGLRRRLAEAEAEPLALGRYELMSFEETGAIAYRLKSGERREGEPDHFACPKCLDAKRRSILQVTGRMLRCPECNLRIFTKKDKPLNMPRIQRWPIDY